MTSIIKFILQFVERLVLCVFCALEAHFSQFGGFFSYIFISIMSAKRSFKDGALIIQWNPVQFLRFLE